jgi:hypothetical protein
MSRKSRKRLSPAEREQKIRAAHTFRMRKGMFRLALLGTMVVLDMVLIPLNGFLGAVAAFVIVAVPFLVANKLFNL